MSAQQIQGLVVAAAALALGVVLLVVDEARLPPVLKPFGRHRRVIAIGVIICALIVTATELA